ncbi:ATP-binding protein [Endothiovibrio diazotrophicus]
MRIKTLLMAGTLLSTLLIAGVGGVLFDLEGSHRDTLEQGRRLDHIGMQVFQLSSLTADYLLHPTERAARQWHNKHRTLEASLEGLRTAGAPLLREPLEELRGHHREIGRFFDRLAVLDQRKGDTPAARATLDRQRERLGELLQTRAQLMAGLITILTERVHRDHNRTTGEVARLMNAMVAILGVILIGVWGFWGVRVFGPIQRLREALARFDVDDPQGRLAVERRDEIGEVADAFNRVAERLRATTRSRDHLSDEVERRKQVERALEQARNAADAANRAKSEFLATMSHEIRTPMNVVIGMADVLLEGPLGDDQRHQVQLLRKAGDTLLGLIDNILDLSKIEARRLELHDAPVDPRHLLDEICSVLGERVHDKGLMLSLHIAPGVPPAIRADPTRLLQVLINLIGNAIKFTDAGEIGVTLALETEQRLRFTVTDSGVGIAAEHLEQIFDHFTQADTSITRRYGGSGLGLAICKRLVELMGGEIGVHSRPGEGSRFTFTLPLVEAPPIAALPTGAGGSAPTPPSAGARLLLVEDSEDNRTLIATYLKRTPHRLEIATDGEEAVRKAAADAYDLILMDIQMPLVDGYEATRRIRERERRQRLPATPIVALTAHALHGDEARSLEAGCDGHLTKPIRKARLLEAIDRYAARPDKRTPTGEEGPAAAPL